MLGAGIHDGDLLIVDRAKDPKNGSVIIVVLDGQLAVKRLGIRRGKVSLEPENDNYPVQNITEDLQFDVRQAKLAALATGFKVAISTVFFLPRCVFIDLSGPDGAAPARRRSIPVPAPDADRETPASAHRQAQPDD